MKSKLLILLLMASLPCQGGDGRPQPAILSPARSLTQNEDSSPAAPQPGVSATAAPSAVAAPVPAVSAATPDQQSLEDGIRHILESSESGFLDLRGELKKSENGSGVSPLFQSRKLYKGTFLCWGAASAELEEIYFRKDHRPGYNYRLFFQSPSASESAAKYDDLMVGLQQALKGFKHTHANGYEAWVRSDEAQTAVLLSVRDEPELLQVQFHVAFPSPKW